MELTDQIKVAFAEDHVAVRKAIISIVEMGSKNIIFSIEADDGIKLLERLNQAATLPDICILDINMPNMDGHTVLLEIRKKWPSIKFLILTAFNDEYSILRMIKSGAGGYLLKSCSPSEIVEALEDIHLTGYHYSDVASKHVFSLVDKNIVKIKEAFSEAELDILRYSTTNLSFEEMAAKMNLPAKNIEGKKDRLYAKLKIKSRAELALFAFQSGLVPLENDKQKNHFIS